MSLRHMNKQILILGSSGLIGSRMYKFLKDKNIPVKGISRSKCETTDLIHDFSTEGFSKKIQELISDSSLVINLLSIAHIEDDTSNIIDTNIKLIKNALAYDYADKTNIYFSSEDAILDIKNNANNNWPFWIKYGVSKGECEKLCLKNSSCIVLRLPPFLDKNTKDREKRAFRIPFLNVKILFCPEVEFIYTDSENLFSQLFFDRKTNGKYLKISPKKTRQSKLVQDIDGFSIKLPRLILKIACEFLSLTIYRSYRELFKPYFYRKFNL